MDSNKHIEDYLKYYLSFPTAPQFAVLLDGPWGIGKTFFVKNFLSSFCKEEFKYVYVSLYGLSSIDDIDKAVFHSMYPILEHKGVQLGGKALKSLFSNFIFDVKDLEATNFFNKSSSDVYIFDDLERCEMPINVVMGYINSFVEHDARKVIIIANENEINKKDQTESSAEYKKIREKLIGKTFHIQSVFKDAMESFIDSIQNKQTKSMVEDNTSTISDIYCHSELNNLRILQQSIWDFARLYESLEEKHKSNNQAMTALLKIVLVFSFELKAGRLTVKDIESFNCSIPASFETIEDEEKTNLSIDATKKRYPTINFTDTLLSIETLINLLSKGIINEKQIHNELDNSHFFITVSQEPCWRTVWYSHERTELEVSLAVNKMEEAFLAYQFTKREEILHIFGLRLWLAKINAIQKTKDAVIKECKKYVDYLYQKSLLELPSYPNNSFTEIFGNYAGLGVYQADTPEYKELFDYLNEKYKQVEQDKLPDLAQQLLVNLAEDPSIFLQRICLTNHQDNEFYNVPVLAYLDPQEFINILLDLHPSQQTTALLALKLRYENMHLDRVLGAERKWAETIRYLLFAASEQMSPISKDRIQALLTHGLDKVLSISKQL